MISTAPPFRDLVLEILPFTPTDALTYKEIQEKHFPEKGVDQISHALLGWKKWKMADVWYSSPKARKGAHWWRKE